MRVDYKIKELTGETETISFLRQSPFIPAEGSLLYIGENKKGIVDKIEKDKDHIVMHVIEVPYSN